MGMFGGPKKKKSSLASRVRKAEAKVAKKEAKEKLLRRLEAARKKLGR